jgi:hypothetical protein
VNSDYCNRPKDEASDTSTRSRDSSSFEAELDMFRAKLNQADYLTAINLGVDVRKKLQPSGNLGGFESPDEIDKLVPNV